MNLYTEIFSQECRDVNEQIYRSFISLNDDEIKEKTHLFNGRYENIYLDDNKIPQLTLILDNALINAANILNIKKERLAYGFWLNMMGTGDVTTAHTHDDDDELLSCVYYVKVPEHSGELIITENNSKTVIMPKEGSFIFFLPSTLHEVSENKSAQSRLSIAFNFGLIKT